MATNQSSSHGPVHTVGLFIVCGACSCFAACPRDPILCFPKLLTPVLGYICQLHLSPLKPLAWLKQCLFYAQCFMLAAIFSYYL